MYHLLRFTGGFASTNGYLLALPSGDAILIDAPEGVASWPELQKVKLHGLLITHAHFDHVTGAAAVARRFKCPIHAFAQPDPSLTLVALAAFTGMTADVPDFEVSELLTDSMQLTFPGFDFRVLHVPGHSPDSLCFALDDPDARGRKLVFSGDVLFRNSIGRTDFPHGNHPLLLQGIQEKLYQLPEETLVYPGHGPATSIGEEKLTNPFVQGD